MSQFQRSRDYYEILGASEQATLRELEQLYKRMAGRLHPDKGGNEEDMKSLNEAYRVLKDPLARKEYDASRVRPSAPEYVPVAAPAAKMWAFWVTA